jgi:hypothetical protein
MPVPPKYGSGIMGCRKKDTTSKRRLSANNSSQAFIGLCPLTHGCLPHRGSDLSPIDFLVNVECRDLFMNPAAYTDGLA